MVYPGVEYRFVLFLDGIQHCAQGGSAMPEDLGLRRNSISHE